ncbi:MAG: hypothetical protein HY577_00855 [Candidatus Nealsonbacteria bacterium]|nr:hypothetical protein [Candidatus Nealsonbacteria bacterium]
MFVLEVLAKIIFLGSLTGMLVIFFRKAPLLASLPKTTPVFEKREGAWLFLFRKLKEKLKDLPFLKDFSPEMFLQRILSRIRIFTLKLESKTGQWLEALRKRSQKNKVQEKTGDQYWESLEKKDKNTPA